jgi:hypothetical protein
MNRTPTRASSRAAGGPGGESIKLPAISPSRSVRSTAPAPDADGHEAGSGKTRDKTKPRPSTNAMWGLPDPNDINACAYRVATPLQLSYCEPISYDSPVAQVALNNRQRRAKVRQRVREQEMGLLADVLDKWHAVARQRRLEDAKFQKVSEILGGALGHPLSNALHAWAEFVDHLKLLRERLSKFAYWFMLRELAMYFCRWQIMWAGCVDTR